MKPYIQYFEEGTNKDGIKYGLLSDGRTVYVKNVPGKEYGVIKFGSELDLLKNIKLLYEKFKERSKSESKNKLKDSIVSNQSTTDSIKPLVNSLYYFTPMYTNSFYLL